MPTKTVVRRAPKKKTPVPPEATQPGDMIEFSVTEEVRTSSGSRWVKIGLTSQHRPDETSDEAVDRIEGFVTTSINAYTGKP